MTADTLDEWLERSGGCYTRGDDTKPATLRARLRAMPPVMLPGLWPNKLRAIANLENSLFDDRPRALMQMATGTGKTLLAVAEIYRLIKFGGARRVLFLVDRANLGEQAELEFQGFRTPDDNRKFTELYNVQQLTSNTVSSSSKVVISTIQRLHSILKGEPDLDPELEEHTSMDGALALPKARRRGARSCKLNRSTLPKPSGIWLPAHSDLDRGVLRCSLRTDQVRRARSSAVRGTRGTRFVGTSQLRVRKGTSVQ
jgi:hypothetical protein